VKNVSVICLISIFLGAGSLARAQGVSRCFRADWLQGERTVNLTVDGGKVTGTFTVGNGGDDSRRAATYDFGGTLKGNTLTVAFDGGRLPDVAPSEMKSLRWTLVKSGGKELLRIKFSGKNYVTNKYEEHFADFESCDGVIPASAGSPQDTISISSIRRRYADINKNLAQYKVVKKELSGFSTEGGELIAYFDGPGIAKIAATYYGETGRSLEEFYYWDGKLIFVFRKQDSYDKPMSGKVVKTRENRFYFSNDELVRWINENAKQVATGNNEYREMQTHYLDSSRRFTDGARSQETVIEAPESHQ